jgi:transcriptional regulator with XRE-family HTH domain
MNKKEVAAALGLPYTTYNNYETGARETNPDILIMLARFYNVSADDLLGNKKVATEPDPLEGLTAENRAKALEYIALLQMKQEQ